MAYYLSASTDVVTLTLGGNDVGFVEYATSCEASGLCDAENSAYEDIMEAIDGDLSWKLETVYQEILDRAENATIYVSGYPYLVDPTASCVSFGWADDAGVVAVIDHLNDTIENTVNEVESSIAEPTNAGRIEYVEPNGAGGPFEDHYLCSAVPYFVPAVWFPDQRYSLHPNQWGQAAYKSLFEEAIN